VFGIVADSLGLISDAGHNLTDVVALLISLFAVGLARRRPTSSRSFGWHRGTILAAQVNSAMILLLTVWITYESIERLLDPPAVQGGIVVVVALVAFVANAFGAVAVHEGGHGNDPNMRSALLHLVGDALASLGVAVAGVVMVVTDGSFWLDPLVSLLIGVSIAWHALKLLRASTAVLLEGSPEGLDVDDLARAMAAVDGVDAIHDLHVWSLSSELRALSAHIVVSGHPSLEEAQRVGARVKHAIAEPFSIAHSTLELECETCEDDGPGCGMGQLDLAAAPHLHQH